MTRAVISRRLQKLIPFIFMRRQIINNRLWISLLISLAPVRFRLHASGLHKIGATNVI